MHEKARKIVMRFTKTEQKPLLLRCLAKHFVLLGEKEI